MQRMDSGRQRARQESIRSKKHSQEPETGADLLRDLNLLPDLEVDVSGELEVTRSRRTGDAADLAEV